MMNFCFVSFLAKPTKALFLESEILGDVKKPNHNKTPSQLPHASPKKFKMEGSRCKT